MKGEKDRVRKEMREREGRDRVRGNIEERGRDGDSREQEWERQSGKRGRD